MFGQLPYFSVFPFFAVEASIKKTKKKKLDSNFFLLDFEKYKKKKAFANIYMGWSLDGISLKIVVNEKITEVSQDYRKGDSVELFFDTRDVKTKNYFSRFCHHFVFYPAPLDDIQAKEVTRFHSEEVHPLCKEEDLLVEVKQKRSSYEMYIVIPERCLYGFDPKRFNRLGFTYQINRFEKEAQVFTTSIEEFKIDRNPSVWASLILKGK